MSCHCKQCKKNMLDFYYEFFKDSGLFRHLEDFSDNQLSDQRRGDAWTKAHNMVMEAIQAVNNCLKRDWNLIRFAHLEESLTRDELETWILGYICQKCWDSQPLRYPTNIYFFQPVAADLFYAIDSGRDFVKRNPGLKKNSLKLFSDYEKKRMD